MTQDFDTLQEVISHRFSQVKLLETALTHSSFANEHEDAQQDNERLEFLGDAVLELGVSEMLYERNPGAPEGELTRMRARLVSEPALAALARELGLDELLRLGRGEELQGGRTRDALLADAFEAVLGAVFLDGGFAAARAVLRGIYSQRLPAPDETRRVKDAKSRLQELTQKDFRERPAYALLGGSGPDHAKVFEVELTLPDGRRLRASGPTVKKAEQDAAARALELLQAPGVSRPGEA
jgi:ribonuclease-3